MASTGQRIRVEAAHDVSLGQFVQQRHPDVADVFVPHAELRLDDCCLTVVEVVRLGSRAQEGWA